MNTPGERFVGLRLGPGEVAAVKWKHCPHKDEFYDYRQWRKDIYILATHTWLVTPWLVCEIFLMQVRDTASVNDRHNLFTERWGEKNKMYKLHPFSTPNELIGK